MQIVAHESCELGEAPTWHPEEQRLYWADIARGRVHFLEPKTGLVRCCYAGRPVAGMTLEPDGAILFFRDRGNVVAFRDGQVAETIIDSIPELSETRFNDVIADPEGRVFAGSMSFGGRQNGFLLRLDPDGSVQVVSRGHATPNGMAFSVDNKSFYFTDSRLRRIYLYDYDRPTGKLANERIWQEVSEADVTSIGRSDGMTVAADDTIWSARTGAGLVLRFAPSGECLERHAVPTSRVTSVAFGGPNLQTLYVTSAGGDEDPGGVAGAVFALEPTVHGCPEFRSRLTAP